jgi:hypothetical protein
VTFTVNWNKTSVDSAWVFVDYNNSGTMTRLPLSGATASAVSRVYMVDGNDRGAWVVANASNFSATVTLLTTEVSVFTGACVYAIDYPPKAEYTAADKIKFTGTPPFYLEFVGDSPATVSAKTQGSYTYNIESKTLESFTDATGAPGVLKCALPAAQTLTVSAAGYCADAAGVQFALSGTESGATYQLIKNNTTVATTLTTTGGAATFSGAHLSGTYSAKTVAGAYCEVQMSGSHTVAMYSNPSAPTVSGGGTACTSKTITATPGSGGTGIRWTDNTSTSQSRTVTATGSYYAVTTNSAGCTSSNQGVSVTVYSVPGAPSVSGGGTACTSKTITATPGSGGTGIRWTDNNSTSSPRVVSLSNTYYAVTTGMSGCNSSRAGVSVTIYTLGTDGQSQSPCGCAAGLINCSGTCRTSGTYVDNTSRCTGTCNTALYDIRNQCGQLYKLDAGTYSNSSCPDEDCYELVTEVPSAFRETCEKNRAVDMATPAPPCTYHVYSEVQATPEGYSYIRYKYCLNK